MAPYHTLIIIIISVIPENLVLLTKSEQSGSKSAHIRPTIRDKEAINSTRSRSSSLKGFTSHFIDSRVFFRILNEYFLQNIRAYKYKSLLESKNVMNMARHFNHRQK